jgi:hypothetical protein
VSPSSHLCLVILCRLAVRASYFKLCAFLTPKCGTRATHRILQMTVLMTCGDKCQHPQYAVSSAFRPRFPCSQQLQVYIPPSEREANTYMYSLNTTEHSPRRDLDTPSAVPESHHYLWHPKVHYLIHKSLSLKDKIISYVLSCNTRFYQNVSEIRLPKLEHLLKFLFASIPFEVVPFCVSTAIPAGLHGRERISIFITAWIYGMI